MLTSKTFETDMASTPKLIEKIDQFGHPRQGPTPDTPVREGLSAAAHAHAVALLEACGLSGRDPTGRVDGDSSRHDDSIHAAAEWAGSGAMSLTGTAEGIPRFSAGPLASAMRGAGAALESLLAPALPLPPKLAAALHDSPALLGERAAIFGLTRQGVRSAGGSARILRTRHGYLALNLPRPDDWQLLPAWLEADAQLATSLCAPDEEKRWAAVSEGVVLRDAGSLVERGRLIGLALAPAAPIACTPPARLTIPPFFRIARGSEKGTLNGRTGSSPRRLRLLDLSTLWAGPLATSLLSEAGIDVLKVESPTRPDGARNGPKDFFDLMNGTKKGCALDLKSPNDRAKFERLLSHADVVVESARPRALSQLGYDAESWVTERPGRLWASITGYGREHEWIAFGDDAGVAAGLAFSPDPSDPTPTFCADAIADPLTGLHAAVILLSHLSQGRGGLVDLSLCDIARRAAAAEHAELTLPVETHEGKFFVDDSGRLMPVAEPRARRVEQEAPPLAQPTESFLREWTA